MEKSGSDTLPLAGQPADGSVHHEVKAPSKAWQRSKVFAMIILLALAITRPFTKLHHVRGSLSDLASACQQVDPLNPELQDGKLKDVDAHLGSSVFRNASILRLSRMVQIPSVSFDDMGSVGKDDRFKVFFEIEKYLESTFPLVHRRLRKENVNTHGLLFTWEGSDAYLKPTVLMAHQDVVPVEKSTVDNWTHPPFSGFYDGKYVWGRGSSDCKNQLIAILESVETLLEAGFQPKRTVILSFGFDEEISGPRGAGTLAPYILGRYGKDSVAAVIDEGNGFASRWGDIYALPGVGEKGYIDVHITVRMPGGHSSVPSPHTGIGVISQLVTLIEGETYNPWLSDDNPYLGVMQCGAKYSTSFPKKLKHLLARRNTHSVSPNQFTGCRGKKHTDRLAEAASRDDLFTRYLMQTSQAVDLISGGAKVNALPERVEAVVNHRINIGEDTSVPRLRIAHLAAKVAKQYNLTLYAFPGSDVKIGGSSITLTPSESILEPAPPTPLDIYTPGTSHLSPWGVLSGTTRAIYGASIKMAPGSMTGNTDTKYYWELSRHIFRYNPGFDPEDGLGFGNIHTVDEKQSVVGHVNAVKWFSTWIRNADEASFE